jgi:hypothetical protein
MTRPPLVVIESPWAGLGAGERALDYLRNCIRDSLARGEIPWASHAMLAHTRALYEEDEDQRAEGLETNREMIRCHAQLVVFYTDHGMSPGMKLARQWAGMHGVRIEERKIYG